MVRNSISRKPRRENVGAAFQGITKGAPFELTSVLARQWLTAPINPNGRPNADVLRRIWSGGDIVRRRETGWVVDFFGLDQSTAMLYEQPYEFVSEHVRPVRSNNRRELYRRNWWLFSEPRPGLRNAIKGLGRYIASPKVSRYRVFVWLAGVRFTG